jgi:hypothetical protein
LLVEFQLAPDHWISKPQNYSMVGLTGAASKNCLSCVTETAVTRSPLR